jgi:hypothetical protein
MWIREALDQAMLGFGTGNVKLLVSDNREFIILQLQPAARGSTVNFK